MSKQTYTSPASIIPDLVPMQVVSTVHDAMILAVDASKKTALVAYPLKVDGGHRELCEKICVQNGTSLPEFLRQCMATLIADYTLQDPEKFSDPEQA